MAFKEPGEIEDFLGQFVSKDQFESRGMIMSLRAVRICQGIDYSEMSRLTGWSDDDIMELEACGKDADLTLKELATLTKALKLDTSIRFVEIEGDPASKAAFQSLQWFQQSIERS